MTLTAEQQLSRLSRTLNKMLDKINSQAAQLDAIEQAIATDLRLRDSLISVSDACAILNRKKTYVHQLIQQGRITSAHKQGRKYYMSKKEIESLKYI